MLLHTFLNYRTSIMTTNYSGSIQYLEHVVVTMNIFTNIGSRGDIRIKLASPSGTLSTLLSHRDNDVSSDGYIDWSFMSVMFWGEDPTGEWSLSVITRSPTEAIVSDVEFQFYGVSSIPESVANIPDECHSDCRRGCAEEGSEFCDACVNLRNAYTLECIDTCPLGYTERNGYCYDSTLPTRVCNSPLKNKIGQFSLYLIEIAYICIISHIQCLVLILGLMVAALVMTVNSLLTSHVTVTPSATHMVTVVMI